MTYSRLRKMAQDIIEMEMADSVIIIATRSDMKENTCSKIVATVGNTYASQAAAREWLKNLDTYADQAARDPVDDLDDEGKESMP